ncbi:PSMD12 [Bugula neritina]|uniref:PSMD12 n=1 Tax=Bugula neritina TaxID=10212 RepID=A0A7J7J0R8_BUGNE|nr:PSMD12 [Bugula neritina]
MNDIYSQVWTTETSAIPPDLAVEPELFKILCFLGTLGIILNILNIVTLSMSTEQVTYKILLGMTVADLLVNITLFCISIIFQTSPNTVKIYHIMPISLISILMRLFASISNWSAVLMATIRLLVVTFPLKAAIYASPKRVKVSIGLIYILCIGLQVLFYAMVAYWLGILSNFALLLYVFPILFEILPMAVCLVLTVMLLIQFGRAHAKAKNLVSQTQMDERVKEQRKLTFTSLLTLTFFIITYLPLVIHELIDLANMYSINASNRYPTTTHILSKVTLILQSCNHTGNFFIYITANSTLRKNFLQKFAKVKTAVCAGRTASSV